MWDSDSAYERYMGRWSRLLADDLVAQTVADGARLGTWVDVGCGTGSVTAAALSAGVQRVVALDPSAAFVAAATARFAGTDVEVVQADATSLPPRAAGADAVVSALVLNFTPDPVAALRAMLSTLAPGGRGAVAVWDYADERSFLGRFWVACEAVTGSPVEHDERAAFEVCTRAGLGAAAAEAGWDGPVSAVEITTTFTDPGDLWEPFLSGVGVAGAVVADLPATTAEAVGRHLITHVFGAGAGPMTLPFRAWMVTTTA